MIEEKLKRNVIILSIVFVVMILAVFIKPSMTGYSIYQQVKESNYSIEDYGENIQDLKTKLLVSDTNLSSCSAFNRELLTELEKYSDKFSECNSELNVLQTNFSLFNEKYEKTIKNLGADLDQKNEEFNKLINEKQEEIDDLRLQYDALAENLANNLCCKAKVDNPDISSYKIENNKIICLEEGGLDISC